MIKYFPLILQPYRNGCLSFRPFLHNLDHSITQEQYGEHNKKLPGSNQPHPTNRKEIFQKRPTMMHWGKIMLLNKTRVDFWFILLLPIVDILINSFLSTLSIFSFHKSYLKSKIYIVRLRTRLPLWTMYSLIMKLWFRTSIQTWIMFVNYN